MFSDVVELYRQSGRPALEHGAFAFDGVTTPELSAAVDRCRRLTAAYGSFEGNPQVSPFRTSFEWTLSSNEHARFYAETDAFVSSGALDNGAPPSGYYLVSTDTHGGVDPAPPKLERALTVARFTLLLSRISIDDGLMSLGARRLIFVKPATDTDAAHTFVLETKVTPKCLDYESPQLGLLESILEPMAENRIHVYEHRQLFRVAIASVLSTFPTTQAPLFEQLISAWALVNKSYQNSADCYVQKFSFERLRDGIARAELEFSSKSAEVLGDSAGKLLALPLSIAGLVAIAKSEEAWEAVALSVGILVACILVRGTIANQLLAYRRVQAGFALSIGPIIQSAESLPTDLSKALEAARAGFAGQGKFLLAMFYVVIPAIWLTALAAAAISWLKFPPC